MVFEYTFNSTDAQSVIPANYDYFLILLTMIAFCQMSFLVMRLMSYFMKEGKE